jgi:hypothetical protein
MEAKARIVDMDRIGMNTKAFSTATHTATILARCEFALSELLRNRQTEPLRHRRR